MVFVYRAKKENMKRKQNCLWRIWMRTSAIRVIFKNCGREFCVVKSRRLALPSSPGKAIHTKPTLRGMCQRTPGDRKLTTMVEGRATSQCTGHLGCNGLPSEVCGGESLKMISLYISIYTKISVGVPWMGSV